MSTLPMSPTVPVTKDQIYHLGLDELEIYATFIESDIFVWVNFDNSNYIEYHEYIVTKHEAKGYEAKFAFAKEWIPMFAYYIWKNKSESVGVGTKEYLCIYGSAFRLLGSEWIWDMFYRYFIPEDDYPIRRFDVCIDLLLPIGTVMDTLKSTKKKTTTFKWVWWDIETYYIWDKKKTNKKQLIRIYNKIADILHKKKYKLYSEYLEQWGITRVEIEIRRELARHISIIDIYNEKPLLGIFKKYIEVHTDLFASLEVEKESFHKKQETIKFDTLQGHAYFEFRTKLMISYAKWLYEFGMCPVEILLWEWLIQPQTKYGLGYHRHDEFLAVLKKKQRRSYKRRYALWKEQEETKALLSDIDKLFPNVID